MYCQRTHAAAAGETLPAEGHQQCTTETGLVQGPNLEALHTGLITTVHIL